MKILYYLETFPKLSESFVLNEIHQLERLGHDVSIFAHKEGNKDILHDEFAEINSTIKYATEPSISDFPSLFTREVISSEVLSELYLRINPLRLAASLHRHRECCEFLNEIGMKPDLVHNHFATAPNYAAHYVAQYMNASHTVTTHAFDLYKNPNKHFLQHFFDSTDKVLTISKYNKRYIEGLTNTDVSVVHAGIRPDKFSPGSYETVPGRILTVSRLVDKKGVKDGILAVEKLLELGYDVEYHIIGEGPNRHRLQKLITHHNIGDSVSILNNVSDDMLTREFDEATTFVLPSVIADSGDRDGIPVVLMESMAMKTPPVSTEVSGIPELITNDLNGFTVPQHSPSLLADRISILLKNTELQKEMGNKSREKIEKDFSIEFEVEKLEKEFKSVV